MPCGCGAEGIRGLMAVCVARHRRMISTQKGYIGLVPEMTQIGDSIVILKVGARPVVLRPDVLRPEGPSWKLVGEC